MRALATGLLLALPIATGCGGDSGSVARSGSTDGQALYESECGACHGSTGEGRGATAVNDLDISFDELVDVISNGARGMPKFSSVLNSAQAEAVASYIFTIQADG